jgi:hypothetical protein
MGEAETEQQVCLIGSQRMPLQVRRLDTGCIRSGRADAQTAEVHSRPQNVCTCSIDLGRGRPNSR